MKKQRAARYHTWEEAHFARIEACRCTAMVLAGRPHEKPIEHAWSLAVFFEAYIAGGSKETEEPFGPRDPVPLKVAEG